MKDAKFYLSQQHNVLFKNNDYYYYDYKIAPISCVYKGKTITLPDNYKDYDYFFIVMNIDIEEKLKSIYVKVDDIDKIFNSKFENVNQFFYKGTINSLNKKGKIYNSLNHLNKKEKARNKTTNISLF